MPLIETQGDSHDYFGNLRLPAQDNDVAIVSRSLDELLAYIHEQTVRRGRAIDTIGLTSREYWIARVAWGSARSTPIHDAAIVTVGQACADKTAQGEITNIMHEWYLFERAKGNAVVYCPCMPCKRKAS